MRRPVGFLACTVALLLLMGCAGGMYMAPPSGAMPGQFYSNVTYPAANTSQTQYQLRSEDFEIVGPVRGEGASHSILGLISFGDSGYDEALKRAQSMGADDLANVRVDTRYFNFVYIYSRVDTMISGTGIKWKKAGK